MQHKNYTPDQIAEMTPYQQLLVIKSINKDYSGFTSNRVFDSMEEYMKWKKGNINA